MYVVCVVVGHLQYMIVFPTAVSFVVQLTSYAMAYFYCASIVSHYTMMLFPMTLNDL